MSLYNLSVESVEKAVEELEAKKADAVERFAQEAAGNWPRNVHDHASDVVYANARLRRYRFIAEQAEKGASLLDALAVTFAEAERSVFGYSGPNSTSPEHNLREATEHREALKFVAHVRDWGLTYGDDHVREDTLRIVLARLERERREAEQARREAGEAERAAEYGLPEKDGRKVTHQGIRADLRKHGIAVAKSEQWRGVHVDAAERRFPAVIIEDDTGYWVERKNWSDPGVETWDDDKVAAFAEDVNDVLVALDDLGYQYRTDTHAANIVEGEDVEAQMLRRGRYAVAVTGWKVGDDS